MTPKDKAEELINKFLRYTPADEDYEYEYAQKCALIAVDEIIKVIEDNSLEYDDNYWDEVKQEIENL